MDIGGSLLQGHRAINALTVILASFAGLYGFQSILGHRGGVLRQLIVMIPSGIIYGVSALTLNDLSHGFYARVYQHIFSLSATGAAVQILVLQFALYGFVLSLAMPNIFRKTADYDEVLVVPLIVIFVCLQVVSKTITFAVLLQIANIGSKLPFGMRLSGVALLIPSLVYCVAAILTSVRSAFMFRLPLASHWPKKWWEYLTQESSAATCLIILVVSIYFYLVFLALLAVGWAMLVWLAMLAILYFVLSRLQRIADSLPRRRLTYIALALFLLAAGLQLYQALFL